MKNEELNLLMKKTTLITTLLFFVGTLWAENTLAEEFFLKNQDNLSSVQISTLQPLNFEIDPPTQQINNTITQQINKDPVVAWLLSFPAGIFGLHRAYLGTSGKTVFLYIITAGGFLGIVPMLDWILLLKGIQNGDVSNYIGNRKFIMWL